MSTATATDPADFPPHVRTFLAACEDVRSAPLLHKGEKAEAALVALAGAMGDIYGALDALNARIARLESA